MKKNIKIKKKFVVFLSLYALFFVSYFIFFTFARYATSLKSNGNIVAKWDVSIEGEDNKELQTMIIGDSSSYQSYELSVTSKSEVAINYSVVISNVPEGVKIQVDDDNIYSAIDNTITISNLGSFIAEDTNNTHNHKLTIQVPAGITPFTDNTLDIDVIFTQVDL